VAVDVLHHDDGGVDDEAEIDRPEGEQVGRVAHTVLHNLVVGVVLVFLVQWLFLGSLRSAIIVAA
jgi:multidrug efflux pump subunit AcrB